VGGLGEHPVCHCKFLSLPFLVSSSRAQVVNQLDLHQNRHVSAVPAKDVPFGVLDDDQSRLAVQTPKNRNFGDVNRNFKPNQQKKFKSSYLQNYALD